MLKTIEPYFEIFENIVSSKQNSIFTGKIGVECLRSIQVKWTHCNMKSDDLYAIKLLTEYFDILDVAQEFESSLTKIAI